MALTFVKAVLAVHFVHVVLFIPRLLQSVYQYGHEAQWHGVYCLPFCS